MMMFSMSPLSYVGQAAVLPLASLDSMPAMPGMGLTAAIVPILLVIAGFASLIFATSKQAQATMRPTVATLGSGGGVRAAA
jgi:hypothetical protein